MCVYVCVFTCVPEERMGTRGSVQKLLILSSREAMSLNQGQFCIVSPISNLPSLKHTHIQRTVLPLTIALSQEVMEGTSNLSAC